MANWWPTNKWFVATITAAGTVAGMVWVGDGINTDEEKLLLISLVVQRLAAYWASNDPATAAENAPLRDSRGRWIPRPSKPIPPETTTTS
jgi:hypothetical protein